MTLKLSWWVEGTNDELVPVCQPNDILTVNIEQNKFEKLTSLDKARLNPCWEYFNIGYKCFTLEPIYDDSIENSTYNLFNFEFSFCNLEERRIFTMIKNGTSGMHSDGVYYISDMKGFALLRIFKLDLIIYYYDFERKFTSHIKILLNYISPREVRLVNRSIWIFTFLYEHSAKGYSIDVINIKDEKKWYHIRSYSHLPISLEKLLSGFMLVGNDGLCKDGDNIFFSCKVLYIEHDNLTPFEINKKKFIEFDKPKELENKDIIVFGIFKAIIILVDKMDSNVFYFLNYNEKFQFQFCKRLDLAMYVKADVTTNQTFGEIFIPEIGKMFLYTSANSIVVIDVRTCQVTQILEWTLPSEPYFIKWSEYEKTVNFVCDVAGVRYMSKYVVSCGNTLQELALNIVVDKFSAEKIQTSNLPYSLVQEIMNRKEY